MLKKQRVLISGDSFAAPIDNCYSWTNLLGDYFEVTNIAQAGVSEYKILKQLQRVDVSHFDIIIVVHTSPNRVYIKEHPLHSNSLTHNNCDLIFNDLENSNSKNIVIKTAINYFKYIFDEDYYTDIHNMIANEIIKITESKPTLHLTFFNVNYRQISNWSSIWKEYPGNVNHLDINGNKNVLIKVTNWINQNC